MGCSSGRREAKRGRPRVDALLPPGAQKRMIAWTSPCPPGAWKHMIAWTSPLSPLSPFPVPADDGNYTLIFDSEELIWSISLVESVPFEYSPPRPGHE